DGMAAAGERPAGLWHAEGHALPALFGLASGALREARALAEGLHVDAARMRAHLDLTRGLIFAAAVSARLAAELGRRTAPSPGGRCVGGGNAPATRGAPGAAHCRRCSPQTHRSPPKRALRSRRGSI